MTATLAARGLVERGRMPDDRRIGVLELTETGHDLVDRLFPPTRPRHARLRPLDEGEKRTLSALCRKLACGSL